MYKSELANQLAFSRIIANKKIVGFGPGYLDCVLLQPT